MNLKVFNIRISLCIPSTFHHYQIIILKAEKRENSFARSKIRPSTKRAKIKIQYLPVYNIWLFFSKIVFRQQSQQNHPCWLCSRQSFSGHRPWGHNQWHHHPGPPTGRRRTSLQTRRTYTETCSLLDHRALYLKRRQLVRILPVQAVTPIAFYRKCRYIDIFRLPVCLSHFLILFII